MATLTITKVSGVIFVTPQGVTNPKSYFNAKGTFAASDDNTVLNISIDNGFNTDFYTVPYASLTVGTSTPTTMSSAKVLLNAIFGT